MPTYIVTVKEIWRQRYRVPEADSPEEAKKIVASGGGEIVDCGGAFEYSHMVQDPDEWDVEEEEG